MILHQVRNFIGSVIVDKVFDVIMTFIDSMFGSFHFESFVAPFHRDGYASLLFCDVASSSTLFSHHRDLPRFRAPLLKFTEVRHHSSQK